MQEEALASSLSSTDSLVPEDRPIAQGYSDSLESIPAGQVMPLSASGLSVLCLATVFWRCLVEFLTKQAVKGLYSRTSLRVCLCLFPSASSLPPLYLFVTWEQALLSHWALEAGEGQAP